MKRNVIWLLVFVLIFSSFVTGCTSNNGGSTKPQLKVAAVFPGSIQDADYNTLGFTALQHIGGKYSLETAYSEQVAVSDVERVMKSYISQGYNLIWVHGNQFNSAAMTLADQNPDVIFVVEVDAKPDPVRPNVWYIDRNYYTGFYVLGALAGLATNTGKVGLIGGLEMPFIIGEINAAKQGLKDIGSTASFDYIFVGDFNDPVKARQSAEVLISRGVDVILSALNLGNYGLYDAVKEAKTKVYITTTYTDKKVQVPDNYLTSDLFNYNVVMDDVIQRVLNGEKSGYIKMEYGKEKARYTQFPISNVSEEINTKIQNLANDVEAGKVQIIYNLNEVLP